MAKTELKVAQEQQLRPRKADRALKVISEFNRALVRSAEETELLQRLCHTVVEAGGYSLAWVGIAEHGNKRTIRPVAQAGCADGYLEEPRTVWANTETDRGPIGTAIRTGAPVAARHIPTNPDFAHWRAEGSERRYASLISLPLMSNGQVIGALNICAPEPDAFDQDEVSLLMHLTDDLMHGIESLRAQAEHKRTEDALAQHAKRMEGLYTVATAMTQSLEVKDILYAALMRVLEIVDADVGGIYLYNPDSSEFSLEANHGMSEGVVAAAGRIAAERDEVERLVGWRGPGGQTDRVPGDAVLSRLTAVLQGEGVEDRVAVPFCYMGVPPGAMIVGRQGKRPFTREEIELLHAIADQIGVCAHNARLYGQETKLRAELEAEIKKRSEFLRALVHELKTPVTAVMASGEMLAIELQDEALLALARNLHRSAENLNKRIDELLDVAKGELGMLNLSHSAVNPLRLLHGAAADMTPLVSSYRQSLIVNMPSSLQPVWGDEHRLRQVVLNLLANASKFTPEGGKITLRAGEEETNLVVEVQDNGPGIPEEDQARLFDPYYRLERDREHFSGLGLGLALSKTLVELHGGQIWVRSARGEGSTFSFSVPLATQRQLEEPDAD